MVEVKNYSSLEENMTKLNLHIGGQQAHPDWKILDIEARPEVDFVGNASCLSQFQDHSIEKIYASHILEHFYHALNDELLSTLREWYRVLKPGGYLLVSVPDLRTLCWLYLNPNCSVHDRLDLVAIMYGGQTNAYDVHKVGFDFDILKLCLEGVGFQECQPVLEFNLFNDCSNLRILDTLISLNVVARK